MKVWINILCAVAVFIAFWVCYDYYLTSQVEKNYKQEVSTVYSLPERDKGIILSKLDEKHQQIMIFGSSELSSPYEQNPTKFFPRGDIGYVGIYGGAYSQSTIHAIDLSSLSEPSDVRLVVIVSPQWFLGEEINTEGFSNKFSSLKYYKMLLDNTIPNENKQQLSARVYNTILPKEETFSVHNSARLYSHNESKWRPLQSVFRAYVALEYQLLSTKDKYQVVQYLKTYDGIDVDVNRPVDWETEKSHAVEEGASAVTNNDFYVNDEYFNKYIKDELENVKNSGVQVETTTNSEYQDYELFLEICKQKHINPLIILPPCNGWYYDYIGISELKRKALYDKVTSITREYGFTIYSMADLEYEPYILADTMHLGWEGWYYVDKEIARRFGQNNE